MYLIEVVAAGNDARGGSKSLGESRYHLINDNVTSESCLLRAENFAFLRRVENDIMLYQLYLQFQLLLGLLLDQKCS